MHEAVAAFVRIHGIKRGLHLAAESIGMGERAAKHAYQQGEFAADAERASRADAARYALLEQEIRRLHAEAAQLQHRRLDVAMAGAALDARSRILHGASGGGVSPRAAVTP